MAEEPIEESWTFIGDDTDPELVKKIQEWEPMASLPGRASIDVRSNDMKRRGRESLDVSRARGSRAVSGGSKRQSVDVSRRA